MFCSCLHLVAFIRILFQAAPPQSSRLQVVSNRNINSVEPFACAFGYGPETAVGSVVNYVI